MFANEAFSPANVGEGFSREIVRNRLAADSVFNPDVADALPSFALSVIDIRVADVEEDVVNVIAFSSRIYSSGIERDMFHAFKVSKPSSRTSSFVAVYTEIATSVKAREAAVAANNMSND